MTDPTPDPPDAPPDAPSEAPDETPTSTPDDPLRHSRTSGLWGAVIVASLLLVLLIVFIAQNTDDVQISFLGWEGTAPLAVALLAATVTGVLVTALVGTLRIWQLRRRVRRDRK